MTGRRRFICFRVIRTWRNGERGLSLIEILVALAILAAVAVVFLVGMTTASRSVLINEEEVQIDSLAKSESEYVMNSTYNETDDPPVYSLDPNIAVPQGYSVAVTAERLDPKEDGLTNDDGLQRIRVTVSRGGPSFTIISFKVKK